MNSIGKFDTNSALAFAASGPQLALGGFVIWYSFWTVTCTVLVLSGIRFAALLWAPLIVSVLTAVSLCIWLRGFNVKKLWRPHQSDQTDQKKAPGKRELRRFAFLIGAAFLTFAAIHVGYRTITWHPFAVGALVAAAALARLRLSRIIRPELTPHFDWRLFALVCILFIIYYYGHRPDADDSNFVNLAVGAQRTQGEVFEFDTMLGDGPGPLHLPTYKVQSFELLGAVLSRYIGVSPLFIFHVLLPAVLLPLFAITLRLLLSPVVGQYWFAAALFVLAFLFLNGVTIGGWGAHGVLRFFHGKGFLVTAVLPLIAGATAFWMISGNRHALVSLCALQITAVGFSANGIFAGPAASAFVATAFLISRIQSGLYWKRATSLLVTLLWPGLIAAVIIQGDMAFPSELTAPTNSIEQLHWIVSYGALGRFTLTALALAALVFAGTCLARPALFYMPTVAILTLNPWSWSLISELTGNLGFRIFWAIPAPMIVAMTSVAALCLVNIRRESTMTATAIFSLVASVGYVHVNADPVLSIAWRAPGLKLPPEDYQMAKQLTSVTQLGCQVLAPERLSSILTMLPKAPYPVFARELYLMHYRFTMAPHERALRNHLRLLVDGSRPMSPPAAEVLARHKIYVGTLVVGRRSVNIEGATKMAMDLGLRGPTAMGPYLVWNGKCAGGSVAATGNRQ